MAIDARHEPPKTSGPGPHPQASLPREDVFSTGSLIGMRVGDFRIDRLICNRGLGVVYEGVLEWPPKTVAIKITRVDCSQDMARGYERRGNAVQSLKHPHIAATHASGVEPWAGIRVPFHVMDHVADAMPIRRFVTARRLSIQQRLALFREVCDAVAHGHRQGVFHGYLTPNKILVDTTGSPMVVDYGNFLAVGGCESIPATGHDPLPIDLGYLSPEQYVSPASTIDARADVYSLGAILYELLTGMQPYDVGRRSISEAAEFIRRTRPLSPRRCNDRVTPDLMTLLGNCLKKNRFERFSNAEDIVDALDDLTDSRGPHTREMHRRDSAHTSGGNRVWKGFDAAALVKIMPLPWATNQLASLARRGRKEIFVPSWQWIGLFLIGWAFFWAVAEIAREALMSRTTAAADRRLDTPPPPEPAPSAEDEF